MNTDLLAKLRKVLAMTNSPVEAEAQTAAAILQRILTEHNLSMADLEQKGGHGAPVVNKDSYDLGKAGFAWKLDLAETIATYYFCHPIIDRHYKTVHFVGRPDNVESLKMLYGWVIDQIKRISAEERTKHKEQSGEHVDPLRWQVNFGIGAVERLGQRLRDQRKKDEADANTTALTVHHACEISDWLESQGQSRIDGRLTKQEQEAQENWERRQKERERLKVTNPDAYYNLYPWERPLTAAQQLEADAKAEKDAKRYARNASRRTGRSHYRYESDKEREQRHQASKANDAGRNASNRINLQPFVGDAKTKTKGELA